jgi:uncharacterized protein (TIGR02271 family)
LANTFNTPESLRRLSDADFEVAPGEPDVRGWKVVLADDEQIGKVDELMIDPAAGKVRYLDIDVDRKTFGLERNRHVLVPIASAQLDYNDKLVVLGGMTRAALLKLPEYVGKSFDAGYDDSYRSHLNADQVKRMTRSAEEVRIGKRVATTGEVRVKKHVETEHVRKDVPLRTEQVRVERRPVEHVVGSAEFRDEEIVIPVVEEEAVIEKRPVIKEEIVISKEPVTKHETVETDVRHEEFDVDTSGRAAVKKDTERPRGGR